MFSIILWTSVIVGGSVAYCAMGGQAAPKSKDNNNSITNNKSNEELTEEYFNSLTLEQQQRYFRDNLDLRYYANSCDTGLTDDKYYNAKHAREISRRTGKVFNNINKTY